MEQRRNTRAGILDISEKTSQPAIAICEIPGRGYNLVCIVQRLNCVLIEVSCHLLATLYFGRLQTDLGKPVRFESSPRQVPGTNPKQYSRLPNTLYPVERRMLNGERSCWSADTHVSSTKPGSRPRTACFPRKEHEQNLYDNGNNQEFDIMNKGSQNLMPMENHLQKQFQYIKLEWRLRRSECESGELLRTTERSWSKHPLACILQTINSSPARSKAHAGFAQMMPSRATTGNSGTRVLQAPRCSRTVELTCSCKMTAGLPPKVASWELLARGLGVRRRRTKRIHTGERERNRGEDEHIVRLTYVTITGRRARRDVTPVWELGRDQGMPTDGAHSEGVERFGRLLTSSEVSTERRRKKGRGKREILEKNLPTSGIVGRKNSGAIPPGIEPGLPRREAKIETEVSFGAKISTLAHRSREMYRPAGSVAEVTHQLMVGRCAEDGGYRRGAAVATGEVGGGGSTSLRARSRRASDHAAAPSVYTAPSSRVAAAAVVGKSPTHTPGPLQSAGLQRKASAGRHPPTSLDRSGGEKATFAATPTRQGHPPSSGHSHTANKNRIRLERASQKHSSDTHKTPYDRVKRRRERKINTKASECVNVDVFTQNKRPSPKHNHIPFFRL
ncbi:hypothetical protein PR048_019699 [Dryococelus australis]|uniref:Uncharacterized protein n=1 Tax=Dryococelus australis TaxID=614101 RepID=A0ABQ9H474_9NEOP|nr:hypothetical protein PR048_019699 [Dryococelus australis]